MVAKFQGGPQLESKVLHDHVALKEQKSIAINLLRGIEEANVIRELVTQQGDFLLDVKDKGKTNLHVS